MVAPFNEVEGQRKKEDSLRFEYVKKRAVRWTDTNWEFKE